MSTAKTKSHVKHTLLTALPDMGQDAVDAIKAAIATKSTTSGNLLDAVPQGSLLDHILQVFKEETPISLEIPLFVALTYVSGYLNLHDIGFYVGGKSQPAKLWTVVLAPSGSGKSFALNRISDWLDDGHAGATVPRLQDAASAARFIENFANTPKGMWIRDEFGQFLHQVQHQTHMFDIKDFLLRAYSGDVVEKNTKGVSIQVKEHALSVLGITVGDTFCDQMGAASMIDGFAQRFNYLIAKADPERPGSKFPIFFEDPDRASTLAHIEAIRANWARIVALCGTGAHSYRFSAGATELYKSRFADFIDESAVPESFHRRAMFSGFSYAVIMHVIAEKTSCWIDKEDMARAMEFVGHHLRAAKELMQNYGLSSFEMTIRKAEKLRDRRKSEGKEITVRELIAGIREVSDAQQARSIMEFIR